MLATRVYYFRLHYCTVQSLGNDIQGLSHALPSLNDPRGLCFQFLDLLLTVSVSSGTLPYLSVSVLTLPPLPCNLQPPVCWARARPRWVSSQVRGSISEEGSGSFLKREAQSLVCRLPSLPLGCAQPCFGLPSGSRLYSKSVKVLESRGLHKWSGGVSDNK